MTDNIRHHSPYAKDRPGFKPPRIKGNHFGLDWGRQAPPFNAVVGALFDWDTAHFGPYPYIVCTAMQLENLGCVPKYDPKRPHSIYPGSFLRSEAGYGAIVTTHNIGGSCWRDLAPDEVILNPRAADLLGIQAGDCITIFVVKE